MKGNMKRHLYLGILGLMSLFLLTQYQNCAPPPAAVVSSAGSVDGGSNENGIVTTIDSARKGLDLLFVEKQINVPQDQALVSLAGICAQEQEGAKLVWLLQNQEGEEVFRDYVNCVQGGFKVIIDPAQELECNQVYKVVAQLGLGQAGTSEVVRNCN